MKNSNPIISSDLESDESEDRGDTGAELELRSLVFGAAQHGQRLDLALVELVSEFSRSYLQQLIDGGSLTLNGAVVRKASLRVKAGDQGCIELRPTPQSQAFKPEAMALELAYEDEHLLVINKPAGLVVHPAPGNWSGTLLNGLLAHDAKAMSLPRAGIVHRLDKDTSGLMVAAKTDLAHRALSAQFAAHTLERAYRALVWGLPNPAKGEIEGNIGRNPRDRKKMAVVKSGGKAALTRYQVLKSFAGGAVSLVECRLATGRTHQIRVHMTALGHPLVGDPSYGRNRANRMGGLSAEMRQALARFPRQALHAYLLGFSHPTKGCRVSFESSMPSDINELIKILEII